MPFLQQITFLFIISSIANSAWIFLWHYEYVALSLLMMLILLFSLFAIYNRLNIGRSIGSMAERLCIHVPFSVYLGWITVATIANITAFLVSVNWDGFGISELNWTIIIIAVATLLTILMLALRKDIAFSLVVLWAFFGIWMKRTTLPNTAIDANVATTITIAIIIIAIGLLAVIGYQLIKTRLRVGSVEHELAWIPFFLDQMDYTNTDRPARGDWYRFRERGVRPSAFWHRNCFASFQEDATGVRLRDLIGVASLSWGSDYPHTESTFPRSRKIVSELLAGVPAEDARAIAAGNAARLYGFELPS